MHLLDYTVLLIRSAIMDQDLTDIAMDRGISRSQLSKLDTARPYQIFVEMFYSLVYPYIMSHNYSVLGRFLSIIGIDSRVIRTMVNGSWKYRRQKTENGIKMHQASVIFPFTILLESLVTPANLNDSPGFETIMEGIDPPPKRVNTHIQSWILRSVQVQGSQGEWHHVRDKDQEERQI